MGKNNKSNPFLLKIRWLRLNRHLTHDDCAKRLGISRAAYTNIENGSRDCTLERLIQIAEIFETSAEELIFKDSGLMITKLKKEIALLHTRISDQESEIFRLQAKIIKLYEEGACAEKK